MARNRILLAVLFLALISLGCFVSCSENEDGAPTQKVKIIAEMPHDVTSYCQGFFIQDDILWESAGRTEHSRLMKQELATGKLLKSITLDDSLFAEGAAYHDGQIYQLTWKAGVCLVWNPKTMIKLKKFNYQGEGWGLTSNGKELISSSGSSDLVFRDPKTFEATKRVTVTDGKKSISNLNELEWIDGEVWANIYQTTKIAVINPDDGKVRVWLDCSNLKDKTTNAEAEVLNGIAYDAATKKIYLTGKQWNKTYQIEVEK